MKITQSWVGYLDRSYEQIKRACLSRLGTIAPEISDHSESNPLVIILSMFAGVAEMLNLYIDNMAKEAFIGTARKYSSVVALSRLVDYHIRATNPASVNLLFYLVDSNNNLVNLSSGSVIIPRDTIVYSNSNALPFVLLSDVRIISGTSSAYGIGKQYTKVSGALLGNTNGAINQSFDLPNDYVDSSAKIIINNEVWTEYQSFAHMFPGTKGFVISISEMSTCSLQFGDGTNGAIPLPGYTVFIDYNSSSGASGNIPPNQITTINGTIPGVPSGLTLKVDNPDYASGGSNFEGLEDIRKRAPISIRTLDRAVTFKDYEDLAQMVPGVGDARLRYCCGKYIDIYVAPNSPGVASLSLVQDVQDYLDCRKMVTTQVAVQSSGIGKIWVKGVITVSSLVNATNVLQRVVGVLDLNFGYPVIEINNKISIPNIVTKIEGVPEVISFEIQQVRILPYARPRGATHSILNISFLSLPVTIMEYKYTIQWNQNISKFLVYKGTILKGEYAVNDIYLDDILSFKILPSVYVNGDSWEFTAYPSYPEIFPSAVIQIQDFTAAIIEVSPFIDDNTPREIYSDLTVVSTNVSSNCLPPC